MVRITLFSRRNRNTMAFMARLFMLLAIAVSILQAGANELPEEFPPGHEQGNHIHAVLQRIRDACPPFGHSDNRFDVTVLGTISPEIGGCASMTPSTQDFVPSFNLWLGSPKTGGGNCNEKNMDHYIFECMAKHPFFTEKDTLEGWYVMLYDQTTRWTGSQDYRCALYKTVNEDPPMIQMVISGNQSCKGLSKRMEQSEYAVPEGFRQFTDGSIAILFSRDIPPTPVWRKKRSEEQGRGCRFPDWSQGSWTDLKVDESLVSYEPTFHEKDDVDYFQENDDRKYDDPENTGDDNFMQRSQRHAPVGISGIDHSSSHDSRSHRGRRSIPYINTVKMFRPQTSMVQNNTLDEDLIMHQLYDDYMQMFDSFNYSPEESSVFSDQPNTLSNTNMQFPESVKSSNRFDYKDTTTTGPQNILDPLRQIKDLNTQNDDYKDTTKTGPQNYLKDLNKNSFNWNIILDQLRQIKDLGNQHDDYKHTTTAGPQNYPKDLNKSSYEWNIILDHLRKIKELNNQFDYYKHTTTTNPQNYPKDSNKNSFNWNIILDQLRQINDLGNQQDEGKKETNNEKKRCFCYTDFDAFTSKNDKDKMELFNKVNKYSSTQKYPENLKDKSNYPFDAFELRKKRELSDQDVKEDTKHQQKIKYHDRDFEPYTPGDMDIPKILDEKYTFSTNKKTTNLKKKFYQFDYVQRKKRDLKHLLNYGEKEIYNKKKNCYCYSDSEGFLPKNGTFIKQVIRELIKYLPRTKTHIKELKDKSNHSFNLLELRKKRELGDQDGHDTENINNRKKKCVWLDATTTTTERYRDLNFEYPYKGEPLDPSHKPEVHFGTTQDPRTYYPRQKRSIFVDEVIKDDEEEAIKKIKMTDNRNRRIRWWNIMRAIEYLRNSPIWQLNGDTNYDDDTPVTASVKYLKNAEARGVPYKQALLDWRAMERTYRQRIAESLYTAFPGQNHPDIIMRDFDQTYDGIEYDFDPMHPEGTADDPIAYRALTLPNGYQIEPRLSRRTMFEQKQSSDSQESTTAFRPIQVVNMDDRTDQENTQSLNQRRRRSSIQQNQQQHETTSFTWRCEMAVDNDVKQLPQFENGAKFLTYGGRVVENNEMTGNDQQNEQDSKMTYGCLWLVPRGPNILEFSMIGTGIPAKNQSLQNFARQLCNENHAQGTGARNDKKLRLRRPSWVTETRTDHKKRVPVRCPVPPGIVFYGVVPAPPPPPTVSTNKDQITPLRLCAKLVSSADDCTAGQMGPADQMKYTVSECVEQDSSTGTSQTEVAQQTIFEAASRGYTVGGSWRRNKRHSAPTDTSTIASSVVTTSTSSNIPILPFSSHNPSTGMIDNITDHHTIGPTSIISSPMTPPSMISSITEIPPFAGITTIDPTNVTTTTTTATTHLTTTASILPLSSPQETPPERQLQSISKSSTTTTTPSTSTASVTTTSSYHQVTDYQYRQQQQWQQQHQQPNNNNNDYYYYRGRQQHYPPPPPGSTGMDNNYYYIQQQQQQQWQQQHPQTQPHWLPQQYPISTNDYSNGYQHQTSDSGGYRTGDYYYRQQQQNYHNHQHNNDRQQQTPQPPRNSSLTLQHPNGGSWNVRGERPLYISSGGGGNNNRDAPVAWNRSTSTSSNYNGGWTTAAQQHWWYQQQQQQQLQQLQLQQHQRQQQNNRGLGGILSLQPVPLPPLHVEQGAVTISMPTPEPLHPRRQHKPPNHYYLPTLTTKTSSQPYQLRPKSESRYYQEREYQCIGQWTEPQEHFSPVAGEKPVMLTYTYLKRLSPVSKEGAQYECFVGTPIPNDEGLDPETTTTILLTEAGTNTKCSRFQDPYRSGMKLVGTKIKKEGACKGSAQPVQDTTGGSWYSLKPQSISPSIPGAENGRGAWYAAPPVPVIAAQGPTTMPPILTGRHTGGNGATFTARHNEQNRRPQSANLPPKTNHSFRTIADKRIVILAVILFTAHRFFN